MISGKYLKCLLPVATLMSSFMVSLHWHLSQGHEEWILVSSLVSLTVAWEELTSFHVSTFLGLWGVLNSRILWQMSVLTSTKPSLSKCWFSFIYQGTSCFPTCPEEEGLLSRWRLKISIKKKVEWGGLIEKSWWSQDIVLVNSNFQSPYIF